MKTNDIKAGMKVQMRNGWYGIMKDNMRGNTRMVEVHGHYVETGSVYASNIVKARVDNVWHDIEHTAAQKKAADVRKAMGF